MPKYPKIKKLLSFLLAFLLVIGAGMPASAADSEGDQTKLFARWPDGSGFLAEAEIPVGMMSPLEFCFGTEESFVVIPMDSAQLQATGVAQLSPMGSMEGNGTQVLSVTVSDIGEGAVMYTHEGKTYTFSVTGTELPDGDLGSDPEIPSEPHVFARWPEGNDHMLSIDIFEGTSSPLEFLFHTEDNDIPLTPDTANLRATGIATLQYIGSMTGENGQPVGEHVFDVGVTGLGEGAIIYTAADGTEYTFPIQCIEYSGDDSGSEIPSEPHLFTRWDDGSGHMLYSEIFLETTSPLEFCFGTVDDFIVIEQDSGSLRATGVVTLTPITYIPETQAFDVGVTGIGEGTVIYTAADGTEYTYHIFGIPYTDPSEPEIPSEPHLFTRWSDGSGHMLSSEIPIDCTSPLEFFFGTEDDCIPIELNSGSLRSEGVATLTPTGSMTDENGNSFGTNVFTVGASEVGEGMIVYTHSDDTEYYYPVTGLEPIDPDWNGGSGGGGVIPEPEDPVEGVIPGEEGGGTAVGYPTTVDVQYGNQTVTVGIGMLQENTMTFVYGYGDMYNSSKTHDFSFRFILAALTDHATAKEAVAPQSFYDCISDVRFYIPYWVNEDGSTDVSNCMLSSYGDRFDAAGTNTWRTVMVADNAKGFDAQLAMDFTLTLPGEAPKQYSLATSGQYFHQEEMKIYANDPDGPDEAYLDTAEKLNAVLSSRENLKAWLSSYFPEEYSLYDEVSDLFLYLPAVTYTDTITVNCRQPEGLWEPQLTIFGATDSNNTPITKMPGFVYKGGVHILENIHFVGDPAKKVTYGNKSFTCGILGGADDDTYYSDMVGVQNCIFENLDYGIYDTPTGYHGHTSVCTFINCEYGWYLDCQQKYNGAANDEHTGNTFSGCKFAVWVKSLPSYITPYMLRVVDNYFLNNQQDIKVSTPGRNYYYFYRNYYYGTYQQVIPRNANPEGRGAIVDTTGSEAVVITSPSRRYANSGELWIYEDSTSILSSEADNLQIAQEALTDLESEVEISIVENANTGEAVAVWTFGVEGGAEQ